MIVESAHLEYFDPVHGIISIQKVFFFYWDWDTLMQFMCNIKAFESKKKNGKKQWKRP